MLRTRTPGPYATYSGLTDSDLTFADAVGAGDATAEVTQGSIHGLLGSSDRALRRSAWESYADGYRAVRNAIASNYATAIKQDVFSARARRHASTRAASLHASNVPLEVFDNLLATFERNLPTWHRYWRVRASLLGVDSLQPYDLWAPLGSDPPELTYEQCVEWICEALAPLGDEYVATVRRGSLEDRWIDVYPNQGKMSGAFSAGQPGTRPFIVMSFDGTAVSLGTLAHELGHSMHSYLAWETQPQISSRYSLFVAEVASNFHQVLLRAHLLETISDRELQLAVLDEAMANFHRYFFVMPTLARFEQETHERVERGEGLTAELLDERMADLFGEAYGPDFSFDRERVGITWAQFSHLYAPFYVYQYATGISGAHALGNRVLAGEPGAAERYLDFLRAGGSGYPLDLLRDAGSTSPRASRSRRRSPSSPRSSTGSSSSPDPYDGSALREARGAGSPARRPRRSPDRPPRAAAARAEPAPRPRSCGRAPRTRARAPRGTSRRGCRRPPPTRRPARGAGPPPSDRPSARSALPTA